ncbi:hypothetical protein [Aliikangiella coralliicola]|uniref:Uncharacterized protein n=1 Tax=Aliikangiella coralliicola TaxID=2592383 RepID=A0A545UJ51_9GAMM|nr:hypothetical protein [Aliikangiella coralliicola]TQV89490.1 hypothetical protein FLL46_01000 [Aliikangiella coralliicola]
MNKIEVSLYFFSEPEKFSRVYVSVEQNNSVEVLSFNILEECHFYKKFISWFENNISPTLSKYNFVFSGDSEFYFLLYSSLYSRGATVSLIG